jgi:lysophospholipase L1-like esterase
MKILLAGDSTVASCPTHEYPMSGWGAQLPRHVYTWAAVHNFAKGGASTESFREEGLWGQLLETAGEGDLVLIQFGHNDQKKVHLAARTGYAANLRTMVAEVRAVGAVPLLCTSVERRHFLDGPTSGGGVVLEESLEDYPEVVRELALELQVPVVDLNTWTRTLYEELGVEDSRPLFCHFGPGQHAAWLAGLADNTHFSQRGASLVAEEVAGQLRLLGFGPDHSPSFGDGTAFGDGTTAGLAPSGFTTAGRG